MLLDSLHRALVLDHVRAGLVGAKCGRWGSGLGGVGGAGGVVRVGGAGELGGVRGVGEGQ